MTSITSSASRSSSFTASCRSCVALQIVSNVRKFSARYVPPLARQSPHLDERAQVAGLFHVAHHEIGAGRVLRHLRRRGACFLVIVLAVNERREAVLRV